jgi:hypothetical protein
MGALGKRPTGAALVVLNVIRRELIDVILWFYP